MHASHCTAMTSCDDCPPWWLSSCDECPVMMIVLLWWLSSCDECPPVMCPPVMSVMPWWLSSCHDCPPVILVLMWWLSSFDDCPPVKSAAQPFVTQQVKNSFCSMTACFFSALIIMQYCCNCASILLDKQYFIFTFLYLHHYIVHIYKYTVLFWDCLICN